MVSQNHSPDVKKFPGLMLNMKIMMIIIILLI